MRYPEASLCQTYARMNWASILGPLREELAPLRLRPQRQHSTGAQPAGEVSMGAEEKAIPEGATGDANMEDAMVVGDAESGKGMAELLGHGLVVEYEAAKPERRMQVSLAPRP